MQRTLGVLFLVGPFVAGAFAAVSARRDFRLMSMAVVATITVWLIRPRDDAPATQALLVFALATVAAAAVAVVAGARGPFGVVAVAVVIAAFAALGRFLLVRRSGRAATPVSKQSRQRSPE